MEVSFAKLQFLMAVVGSPCEVTTDPVPMQDRNYLQASLNTLFFYNSGGISPQLVAKAQGSNDGTTWHDLAVSITATGAGLQSDDDYSTFVFVRFHFALSIDGTAGSWVAVTFDLTANLTRK